MANFSVRAPFEKSTQVNLPIGFFLLFSSLLAGALHFRNAAGDNGIAPTIVGLTCLFMLVAQVIYISRLRKVVLYLSFPFVWLFLVSIFSGSMHGSEIYSLLSSSVPLLIFVFALIAISEFASSERLLDIQINMIVMSAIFAAIFKVILAFSYYGLQLENVRYQALSGATPLLFSFGLTCFYVQWRKFAYVALMLSIGVVFISVTRTYIIALAFGFLPFILSFSAKSAKKIVMKTAQAGLLVALGLAIISVVSPLLAERWIGRIFQAETIGFDITALTRIAQINDQIDQLKNSIFGMFFGFGPAGASAFAGAEGQLLRAFLGEGADIWVDYGYGHNLFVGLFFVGGIIGGLPALFALLSFAKMALFYTPSDEKSVSTRFAFCFGASSFMSYLGYSFFASPLGDRGLSFYMAISIGMMIVGRLGVRIR